MMWLPPAASWAVAPHAAQIQGRRGHGIWLPGAATVQHCGPSRSPRPPVPSRGRLKPEGFARFGFSLRQPSSVTRGVHLAPIVSDEQENERVLCRGPPPHWAQTPGGEE